MALGEEVGDAFISIHADTTKFRADLARLNRVMGNAIKRNKEYASSLKEVENSSSRMNRDLDGSRRRMSDFDREVRKTHKSTNKLRLMFGKFGDKISSSWRNMDRTVRLVLTAILTGAQPLAAILSALSSSVVGLASVLAYAAGGLAVFAAGLTPLVAGLLPLIAGMKDLDKYSSGARQALDGLKSTFADTAVRSFMDSFGGSLENLFNVLKGIAGNGSFFSNLGSQFAVVLDSISGAFSGDAFNGLIAAINGPLGRAFQNIGSSIGPLIEVLFTFLTAAAPVAERLAQHFNDWATAFAKTFAKEAQSKDFVDNLMGMAVALESVLDFAGSVKDVLGTLFEAGLEPGLELLELFTDLLDQFDDWMNTLEGQNALATWFDNGLVIMEALLGFLGQVGTAISDLITPDVIEETVALLDSLGQFAGVLSDILQLLGQAHIVQLLTTLLNTLGTAVEPLLPTLGDLLSLFSSIITTMLEWAGEVLPPLTEAIGTVLSPIIQFLSTVISELIAATEPYLPIVQDLTQKIADLATKFAEQLQPHMDSINQTVVDKLIPAFTEYLEAVLPLIDKLIELADEFLSNENNMKALETVIIATINGFSFMVGAVSKTIEIVSVLVSWVTKAIEGFQNLRDAMLNVPSKIAGGAKNVIGNIGDAVNGVRDFFGFASGGITIKGGVTNGPVQIAGEAGREAIVPLERPLSQIDPSVRWLAAIAQGKGTTHFAGGGVAGGSLSIGEIKVVSNASNPAVVAETVVDRLIAGASMAFSG